MSRPTMIAGNWKMHKTVAESVFLAEAIINAMGNTKAQVVLAPTFLALAPVAAAAKGSPVMLAAQNLFWENQGAYTGEVSAPLIKAAGASHVIIAHSERRQYFAETEKTAALRVAAAQAANLTPILCVGETLQEREKNQTEGVLESQLAGALAGLEQSQALKLVIAYEPVWAIGTGKTATAEQANQAHGFIRWWLTIRFNKEVANSLQILYGGSVKPANAAELLAQPEVDGALVGGASLEAADFLSIIKAAG